MAPHEHPAAEHSVRPARVRHRLDYFAACPGCGYHAEAVAIVPVGIDEDDAAYTLLTCAMPCGWHRHEPYRRTR